MQKKHLVLVMSFVFLIMGFSGCLDNSNDDKSASKIFEEFTMSENGGVISIAKAPVSFAFMEDALVENTTISVETASDIPSDDRYIDGTAYHFGPENISFQKTVQLSIGYNPAKIPAEINESTLRLAKLVNDQWQVVSDSWVNTTTNSVSGIITGFSIYCVRGIDVNVSIDPSAATCVRGGSVQLSSDVDGVPEDMTVDYTWKCSENYGDVFTNNNGMDALYLANAAAVEGGTDTITLILTIEFGISAVYVKGENGIEDWFYDQTDIAVLGVAKATVRIQDVSFSIEPASAKCASGGNTGFAVVSNGVPDVESTIEYRWTCSNMYGNYFVDAQDGSAIAYMANENVPDDSTDSIRVEIWAHYTDGSSEKIGEATATVTIGSVNLVLAFSHSYENGLLDVRGSGYIYIEAKLTNKPSGDLLYVWDVSGENTEGMLGGFGYFMEQHYESAFDDVSFKSSGLGVDGFKLPIMCSVYLVEGNDRELLEKGSISIEIYMPTTIYSLCGSPAGDTAMRVGSGSSWTFILVDHGPIIGGSFYARTGDQIRISCQYAGYLSEYLDHAIYLRKGHVGDPPTSVQLLVSKSEMVTGMLKTVAITL